MTGMKYTLNGKKLVIEIEDVTKVARPSKSGDNNIVASSDGNIEVQGTGGGKLGLNFFLPAKK